jgi:hypothetical protein
MGDGQFWGAIKVIGGRRNPMERKIERGWKSIVCPDGKEKAIVMCEWDILSEMGRILKKTLKQIDCHNPKLTELGGADCNLACKKAIAKEGTTGLGMEWLLVCAIIVGNHLDFVLRHIYEAIPPFAWFVSFVRNPLIYRSYTLLQLENDEL